MGSCEYDKIVASTIDFKDLAKMNKILIAPCGMNCGICRAYLRKTRKCLGCRIDSLDKLPTRANCAIKICQKLKSCESGFCFECIDYPCSRIKRLDKRYRTKYSMSMVENLASIKGNGLLTFIDNEKKRWGCSKCGGIICVHDGCCFDCGN